MNQSSRFGGSTGFPVVGIGASAGGLKALREVFTEVPPDSGMAFVVIVHLAEDHKSLLPELLQSSCGIPVSQVTETVTVEANHVYVIPPGKNLQMVEGEIRLTDRPKTMGRRIPIDFFFRTLAEAYGKDAYAVILSGAGADGTQGIERVKEQNGITMAQTPDEMEAKIIPKLFEGKSSTSSIRGRRYPEEARAKCQPPWERG